MGTAHESTSAANASERRVAELLEELTRRVQSGQEAALEEILARHPEHADEIRRYLPALRSLAEFDASTLGPAASTPGLPEGGLGLLGDFRLWREVGRGGMGVVYEAEQLSLGRRVALKVLPFAAMLDERRLQRFKNEAHAAAVLQHPHIVPVYGVGCERGVHYYAMQLIDGCSLAEALAERAAVGSAPPASVGSAVRTSSDLPLPPGEGRGEGPGEELSATEGQDSSQRADPNSTPAAAQRTLHADTLAAAAGSTLRDPADRNRFRHIAELGIQAATALAYAHGQGVIHRDIKPSNLLIDRAGKLWITDFGLARLQADGHELTLTGDVLGTLRYMSPEQLLGEQVVDERSDVYSLGLTLYELLAGRPAFGETARERLVTQILNQDPPPLRKLDATIPRDLETIVAKSLAKDRDGRYATAQALAEDLRRFVEQKPIKARPLGRLAGAWRWCRRTPAMAGLGAAVFCLALLVSVASPLVALRERGHRHQAEATTKQARWQQYLSDMHAAMAAWDDANVGRVMALLERHRPQPGEPDHRGFEWYYLWKQCQPGLTTPTIRVDESERLSAVGVSPDGEQLVTGGFRGRLMLWDVRQQRLHKVISGHKSGFWLWKTVFSPDGRTLASGGNDNTARVWDPARGELIHTFSSHRERVSSFDYSPDGRFLATASADHTAKLWNLATGAELATLNHEDMVNGVAWLDAETVLTVSRDGAVRTWDARTGDSRRTLLRLPLMAGDAALSHDRTRLAVAGHDFAIRLVDPRDGKLLDTLVAQQGRVLGLAFSPDDRLLATSGDDRRIIVWDLTTRQRRVLPYANSERVSDVAFFPDGKRLGAASNDGTLKIWDLTRAFTDDSVCRGHSDFVLDAAFDRTGQTVVSASADGTVRAWHAATGAPLHVLRGNTNWVWSVACSPRDSIVAAGGWDGSVRLWDLVSGAPLWTAPGHAGGTPCVAFSPDGEELASCGWDGHVRVWDVGTGGQLRAFAKAEQDTNGIAFSPDAQRLAVGYRGSGIALLDAQSGRVQWRLAGTGDGVWRVRFSPDGNLVATAFTDRIVFCDAATGDEVRSLPHAGANHITFSPDGRMLASGGLDNAVYLWDVASGAERAVLKGHFAFPEGMAFSPDGLTLVTASDDATVRLWRASALGEKFPPTD